MQKEKFFIIAAGGYLPKPIVEEFIVDEADMDEEFDDLPPPPPILPAERPPSPAGAAEAAR